MSNTRFLAWMRAQRESQPLDFPFGSAPGRLDLARQLSTKIIHSASPGTGFMCVRARARLWDQAGNHFNHAYIFILLATSICICRALNTLRKELIVRLRPETREKKYPLTLLVGAFFSIMHLIYLHFHGTNLISSNCVPCRISYPSSCFAPTIGSPNSLQSYKSYTYTNMTRTNHKWEKNVCARAFTKLPAARSNSIGFAGIHRWQTNGDFHVCYTDFCARSHMNNAECSRNGARAHNYIDTLHGFIAMAKAEGYI